MSTPTAPSPNPATDLDRIPELAARLRAAFDSGATRPLAWRRDQLERLRRMLVERGEELVAAMQADMGKPEMEAWTADIGAVKLEAGLALRHLKKWTRPQRIATPLNQQPGRARVVREPLGMVLIISPWNYPVQLLLSPLVGALAAGNCALLKPSEVTAHTSAALARFVPEYLDPECVALVEGGVSETTELLRQRFDHIFYTGNAQVARVVMEGAARHLTPVTLELGGKSPCLVDRDADISVAANRIAWGKFLNAGQTCIAPDYVLVHESREQELIEALEKTLRDFYGDDPHETPDFARIVSERHHQRLAALLEKEEVAVGGQTERADRYIAPTILRNVKPDAPIMREEIFGPVLPVLAVPDMGAAIDFVQGQEKPLALYVFTGNAGVEEEVVRRTSSGGVCVNATIWQVGNPSLPFGGVGNSGMGAYHGRHTFETFSHRKAVVRKGTRFDMRFIYPPYGRLKTRLVKRFL